MEASDTRSTCPKPERLQRVFDVVRKSLDRVERVAMSGYIEIGRILVRIKTRTPHGAFLSLFTGSANAIDTPIPMTAKKGQALMRAALDPVLGNRLIEMQDDHGAGQDDEEVAVVVACAVQSTALLHRSLVPNAREHLDLLVGKPWVGAGDIGGLRQNSAGPPLVGHGLIPCFRCFGTVLPPAIGEGRQRGGHRSDGQRPGPGRAG